MPPQAAQGFTHVTTRVIDQHLFEDFSLPFGGSLPGDNRWIKLAELIPWVMEGKLKWKVHVDQGLEGAMDSLQRLFTGNHDGKLLIQVSPEP